jgi:TIR domain
VIEGFWSYVHDDDDAEGGRITQLARDLVAQYELLTGETIELFLDRDNLEWGDRWRAKVDSSLATVAFFIPVLTPRYFLSVECRRELNSFIRKAKKLGLTELLMAILYVDFQALHADPSGDELIDLVRPFQWEDWTDLRFADITSGEYRRAVAGLANRLVRANAAAESAALPESPPTGEDDEEDDQEPGTLELLQRGQDAMDEWTVTLQRISEQIRIVGEVVAASTGDLEKVPGGAELAVRLRVLRSLANELKAPTQAITELSQQYTSQLHDVDLGVRLAIEQAQAEIASGASTPEEFQEFFESTRTLAVVSDQALTSLEGMVESIAPVEKLSRDIRPVLRGLRKDLTVLVEARDVIKGWVNLIDGATDGAGT